MSKGRSVKGFWIKSPAKHKFSVCFGSKLFGDRFYITKYFFIPRDFYGKKSELETHMQKDFFGSVLAKVWSEIENHTSYLHRVNLIWRIANQM